MEDIKIKFEQRVKVLRLTKAISQEKLANLASIDKSYISLIENGKTKVSLEIMNKFAKAYEIEIDQLFD